MGEQRTYTVTLERVMGTPNDFAGYLVTLGVAAIAAEEIVHMLPHGWSGLSDADSRLLEIALQAWGGVVSNTLDATPSRPRDLGELFPNLASRAPAPPASSITIPSTSLPPRFVSFSAARACEYSSDARSYDEYASDDTDFLPEDTIDMAVGDLQAKLESEPVSAAPQLGGTYRWMSGAAVAAAVYASMAVYGCVATWSAEHDFNGETASFGAELRTVDERTGIVDRDDVIAFVEDIAANTDVTADTDRIEIVAHYLDSERKRVGDRFDCGVSAYPPEYRYLTTGDRMRLDEQLAHCEDGWIIGFRVRASAKRLLKTLSFEGVAYTWVPRYLTEASAPTPSPVPVPAVPALP